MIQKAMILLLVLYACAAIANQSEEVKKDSKSKEVATEGATDSDNNIAVVHRHTLATHLGLNPDQDVLFSTPRNFREKSLNEMHLEGGKPEDIDLNDPIDPLTDNH